MVPSEAAASTPVRKSRAKGMLAVLMCVHCSATFFVVVFGLALAGTTVPRFFGVRADVLLIPLLLGSAFFGWLWWGKRAAEKEACRTA